MVDLEECLRYNDNYARTMTDADIRDGEGEKAGSRILAVSSRLV